MCPGEHQPLEKDGAQPTQVTENHHGGVTTADNGGGDGGVAGGGGIPSFSEFSFSDLKAATNNFSSDNIVSEMEFVEREKWSLWRERRHNMKHPSTMHTHIKMKLHFPLPVIQRRSVGISLTAKMNRRRKGSTGAILIETHKRPPDLRFKMKIQSSSIDLKNSTFLEENLSSLLIRISPKMKQPNSGKKRTVEVEERELTEQGNHQKQRCIKLGRTRRKAADNTREGCDAETKANRHRRRRRQR
ncbi:hypothetical protein HID58_025703 [Brassica napus]|uniref:Uncharacterized protein n=1 Tax=Brassica napus TaxID=3708 RepID=A0ABQ8CLY5_BRANA|nr:hypothetical protein HID58_025703 [Brassica napus]